MTSSPDPCNFVEITSLKGLTMATVGKSSDPAVAAARSARPVRRHNAGRDGRHGGHREQPDAIRQHLSQRRLGRNIAQNVFGNPRFWGLTQIITIACGVLVMARVVFGHRRTAHVPPCGVRPPTCCSRSASRSSPSAASKRGRPPGAVPGLGAPGRCERYQILMLCSEPICIKSTSDRRMPKEPCSASWLGSKGDRYEGAP